VLTFANLYFGFFLPLRRYWGAKRRRNKPRPYRADMSFKHIQPPVAARDADGVTEVEMWELSSRCGQPTSSSDVAVCYCARPHILHVENKPLNRPQKTTR
jgi:hypothetical protein